MMAELAMSSILDCEWEPPYDYPWWLPLNDDSKKEVNDPSLELTKCITVNQLREDLQGLIRKEESYFLEDFPLFEEIQSLGSLDELKSQCGPKGEDALPVVAEFQPQFSSIEDLLSASYENSGTFVHSEETVGDVDSEHLGGEIILESECRETVKDSESEEELEETAGPTADEKMTESDAWESDTSRSETSSEGTTGSEASPKGKEEDAEDPEWKPESWKPTISRRRPKPYSRGGSQEDKKLRKKEQNKNAATRYRQKKKAENSQIQQEEEKLRERKAQLECRVSEIQKEITWVKGLMRDLLAAKGFIN